MSPKLLPGPAAPRWRPSFTALLAGLALVLAVYYYFTGEEATLPLRLVPHLALVPLVLDSVAVGPAQLPLPASGFITTLTHDAGGPYTQPEAAGLWLAVLAVALAGWLAVVSGLRRPAFLAGTVPVIFVLLGLNVDTLGLFPSTHPYFLWLSLGLLGGAALGLQAISERVPLRGRAAVFGLLVAGLGGLVFWKSPLPTDETLLQLAAYGVPTGAALVAALLLWVGFENVRALLWFNTQAEQPENRYGLWPFLLASLLYLGILFLYYWNNNELALGLGLRFDPLVLLLPASAAGWLGLRQREPSYADWLPYGAARLLYALLVAVAAGALGYAFATANAPLLAAARAATVLALGMLGAAFLLYVLVNFSALIRQRLRVYRVVFAPRRLPFYTVYIMGVAGIVLVELRNNQPLLDQVQAGQYNQLGDLTRQQSEASPDDLALAVLAERYYAESGDVLDRFNRPAQLGRAALYRFRNQRQNELNALQRAIRRQPDAKVSLHLAALLDEPVDFLDALDVLRAGRQAAPRSFPLTSDLAQLFTRSALTDSVAHYLDYAERLAPKSPIGLTNQLGYLMSKGLFADARKLAAASPATGTEPALLANEALLRFLTNDKASSAIAVADGNLDAAGFASVYQAGLLGLQRNSPAAMRSVLAVLPKLAARPANATYYEQLVFLAALLHHALGQEVQARQQLAPLAAGTGAVAGYYQYVLGIWQLQQQQYAAAATQLTLATTHGATDAQLPRAWALAYSGQRDSAQAVAQRLVSGSDAVVRRPARQLQQALASAALPPPAVPRPLLGQPLLAQARAAEAAGQPRAARLYQQLVQEAPFNEGAMLAAARYYTRRPDALAAYETLRVALLENPDSNALLAAYVLAAADAGLADLGQSALAQLHQRLAPPAYTNLLAQFAAHQAARATLDASFTQDAVPPAPHR